MKHPDPSRTLTLGYTAMELRDSPYAPFWNPVMEPLAGHVKEALAVGPVAAARLPWLTDAPRVCEPGDQGLEDGYGMLPDGGVHVAVRTVMPGVTAAMVDWWFGWHGCEAQRYKLWHPHAHMHAQWDSPDVPGAVGKARYVNRVSFVDEYIGSTLQHATIGFVAPTALGMAVPADSTAVCARIGLVSLPVLAGWLVHHVRPVAGGAEMRSRFWLGGACAAPRSRVPGMGAVVALARRVMNPSRDDARDLLVHCAQEMTHLAGFLPGLYARFGDTP